MQRWKGTPLGRVLPTVRRSGVIYSERSYVFLRIILV